MISCAVCGSDWTKKEIDWFLTRPAVLVMSIQHFGKGALRVAKNYTKGYSDVQAKVRDATSNDPWGPSGTQMNEIAQMTYNQFVLALVSLCFGSRLSFPTLSRNDFVEIMEILDKRLNDKGKNWRHVFKVRTPLPVLFQSIANCRVRLSRLLFSITACTLARRTSSSISVIISTSSRPSRSSSMLTSTAKTKAQMYVRRPKTLPTFSPTIQGCEKSEGRELTCGIA